MSRTPKAGPFTFPALRGIDDAEPFCQELLRHTGVPLLPGQVYDSPEHHWHAHVRRGLGRRKLSRGLERLDDFSSQRTRALARSG